jgi:TorA maturation chaperone TorD
MRRALLVRSEALFTDAIERLLSDFSALDITILDFQHSCESIPKLQPEVIIVDGCLPVEGVDQILALARDLRECRVIMLNPAQNDFILVNSHKTTIRKVEDLMNAIRGETCDSGSDQSSGDQLQHGSAAGLRAETYGFLANMFNQSPDMAFVRRLRMLGTGGFSLSDTDEMTLDVSLGLHEMGSFVESTLEDPEEHVQETLAVDWTRLFRGVSPKYGPPPPYEGVYIEGAGNPSEILQTIMGIYHEHAVDVDEKATNRPDYIGIELDFLRHLSEREVGALEEGEYEAALKYQEAGRNFLLNHVGRWACKYCELAIEEAQTDFYRGFLRLTKGVLNEEINSFSSIR